MSVKIILKEMAYKLSFYFDNLFSFKKYRSNYLITNKNFLILGGLFAVLLFQHTLESQIEEIKTQIKVENKKLRGLRSLL